MSKPIQLSIPTPCHENWAAMTPEAKGRFCRNCAKIVVDFTTMTDAELFDYFRQAKGQSICGRLAPDQINTPVKAAPRIRKQPWFWRYAAAFLLFMGRQEAKAQTKPAIVKTPVCRDPSSALRGKVILTPVKPGKSLTVKGNVHDDSGNPVPNASVVIKGTQTGTPTDEKGNFSITAKKGDVLVFSAVGFDSKEATVQSDTINIQISFKQQILGEIVTVGVIVRTDDELPVARDVPRHIIQLLVTDADGTPIPQAHIVVKKAWKNKAKSYKSDKQGRCTIRRIREDGACEVVITANGYQRKQLTIEGYQLQSGKENKKIVLEKDLTVFKEKAQPEQCGETAPPAI